MTADQVRASKFLSLVLRHAPERIGAELDAQGWTDVDELVRLANAAGTPLSRDLVETIVATSDKQRFILSEDRCRIRANQGHSVDIDLALLPAPPPSVLFHGTATRFIASIRQRGLVPGSRQHVHLSPDELTALKVGARHGKAVVLSVQADNMTAEGFVFFKSANGVWLTDHVPARFLTFPES